MAPHDGQHHQRRDEGRQDAGGYPQPRQQDERRHRHRADQPQQRRGQALEPTRRGGRDAARRAYESALAESSSSSSQGYSSAAPIVEYYTEYVDEFRETPPAVLAGADQAIKQAELSLNVAKQEARETDVIAPVSGTIYYGVEVNQDLTAGDSVSRIGDSHEIWLEAEVSEEIFDKISLGKLASFVIDGKEIFGTVIEKLKPNVVEVPKEESAEEPVELPEIPTSENQAAPLIGENPQPTENPQSPETPPQNPENSPAENSAPQPPKIPDKFEEQQKPNDKFIIKISLPAERDFDCSPNTKVSVKIKI